MPDARRHTARTTAGGLDHLGRQRIPLFDVVERQRGHAAFHGYLHKIALLDRAAESSAVLAERRTRSQSCVVTPRFARPSWCQQTGP